MELEIKGETYRTGRLNAFQQFHVARKLAPAVFALGKSAGKLKPLVEAMQKKNETGSFEGLDTIIELVQPMVEALGEMKEEDVDYVLKTCMTVCERKQGAAWARTVSANGRFMFEDVELPELIQLTVAVVRENLANFFTGPLSESPKELVG
jgi:Phage tail assembly chaperone protein, TAC